MSMAIINFIKYLYVKIKANMFLISIFSIFIVGLYVFTISDFYFHIQYDILKQQEKLAHANTDVRYYDVIELNAFCNTDTFNIYMSTQPIVNQLRVNKICSELANVYLSYVDK